MNEDLQEAYDQASMGTDAPDYIISQIEGLGCVELTPQVIMVNGIEATPEQLIEVAKFFHRDK